MLSYRIKRTFLHKAISLAILCSFLVNDVAFALSPASRFDPSVKSTKMIEGFKEDAIFMYLCQSIGRFVIDMPRLEGYGMSKEGLERHLQTAINVYFDKNYPALTSEQSA